MEDFRFSLNDFMTNVQENRAEYATLWGVDVMRFLWSTAHPSTVLSFFYSHLCIDLET